MAETGGTTTQDGIYYHNSVAAQFLAELLSLQPSPPREQVVEVRVEAPTHVDDIMVRYADGHRDWIQAKSSLRAAGEPWTRLWTAFARQAGDATFGAHDRLVLALGKHGTLADDLRAMVERVSTAADAAEWRLRLGADLGKRLDLIVQLLPGDVSAFDLFRLIDVRLITQQDVEFEFHRLDLGASSNVPKQLLSNLRDLVGGYSRTRGTFRAGPLRQSLAKDFDVDLFEPRDWGLPAYRNTLRRLTRIEIPGRGVSAPVEQLFVWPRARRLGSSPSGDFEDETPRWDAPEKDDLLDLGQFPTSELAHIVIVAGPGFGKSTLVQALTSKLVNTPVVPVEVYLGAFALSDQSVVEYLENRSNQNFAVRVDWRRLADQGLACVLFDGLDEVPTSKRGEIIKRIGLFSARFPEVSWVLTVRDPGVLDTPLDAELIELQPFENREISALLQKYRPWATGLHEQGFFAALEAYPDIARLARIPLFLSIMLASWSGSSVLPRKRSDLIESYLRTLFNRERHGKKFEAVIGSSALRLTAQAIAFASLEREQIGLSEREVLQTIANLSSEPTDRMLSELEGTGVLRRKIDGRLQFPYPIVQEYLAAVHLVDNRPEEVAHRIGDVIKRPWAQVLQFALELISDPSIHIRRMLDQPDDAFSTSLRLIGRCVANGATVDGALKDEILVRLAELWGRAGWAIREKVGRIIVDGFSSPLHPEIRRRLGWHWLLQSGADEIILRENDPVLTAEVVEQLLAGPLEKFMMLRCISQALQLIASEVAAKVVARAYRRNLTEEELLGLAEFLEAIRLGPEDSHLIAPLANDADMPLPVRFAAHAAMADPPDPDVLALARTALADNDWRTRHACVQLFGRAADPADEVGKVLLDDALPSQAKDFLLGWLRRVFPDQAARRSAVNRLLDMADVQERHLDILRIYAATEGDRVRFTDLLNRLDKVDAAIASGVLAILNHFPEVEIGALARSKLAVRQDPLSSLPSLMLSAVTGLTSLAEEWSWSSYGVKSAPLHPDFGSWAPTLDVWFLAKGLSKVQRLRMIDPLIRFRPELLEEMERIVLSANEPDAAEWDEDDGGHVLRHAMDALRRRGVRIPTALAETFTVSIRPNLPYAGVAAIAAEATPEALDRLFILHHRIVPANRQIVIDAIELLASRLNRMVTAEDLRMK